MIGHPTRSLINKTDKGEENGTLLGTYTTCAICALPKFLLCKTSRKIGAAKGFERSTFTLASV